MRPFSCCLFAALLWPLAAAAAPRDRQSSPAWDEQRIALPLVGTVTAYVPRTPTTYVVIFVSGEDGWKGAIVDLARRIAAQAVVIGVPYPALKKTAGRQSGCWYAASDLELISHSAEKMLKLPQYHPPVLVGFSAGASLVYAALAGAPAVTFAGAISIGFCPSLEIKREMCAGDAWDPEYNEQKHTNFLPPTRALPKDWYVLQGAEDAVCLSDAVRRFAAGMPKMHFTAVEGARHSLSRPALWGTPFDNALQDLWARKDVKPPAAQPRSATTRDLGDDLQRLQLPVEYRWPAQPSALIVFFSGDGGWASLDEEVAEVLVTHGIGVIGISSLRYFWNTKAPAQVAADMRRLVAALERGGKPILVGGFSFGAEIVPVALREWAPSEREALSGIVLVAPGPSASFEINPLDWIRKAEDNPGTRVAPAVRALSLPTLCLAGIKESDTPCALLNGAPGVRVARLPGSHHFNGDYTAVGETVSQFIRAAVTGRRP